MDKPKNTRWKLVKISILLSSVAFFVPGILNFILQFYVEDFQPFKLLDAGSWVAIMTIVLGMYKISNIAQDHIFTKNTPVSPEELENPPILEENEGD